MTHNDDGGAAGCGDHSQSLPHSQRGITGLDAGARVRVVGNSLPRLSLAADDDVYLLIPRWKSFR